MYGYLTQDTDFDQIERDLTLCDRVFVYGTLQEGHGNNSLLMSSDKLKSTQTAEPFVLGDVGFPYAFDKSKVPDQYKKLLFPVRGEVYKLDSMFTLLQLDGLEGYPSHYNRRVIRTACGLSAWMYMQDDWGTAAMCNACNLNEGVWQWASNY